jgi:phage terminase Nu1 subunit (DNA packaging protein)
MASLFKCTERQVQLLAEDKIVVRVGHGLYDFAKSTQNYVEHLRAQAAGRAGVDPETDTAAANRERAIEQTALARTKRLAIEGKLIDVEHARELGLRLMRGIRQFVLGLPNAIAHETPTLTNRDIEVIRRVCRDGLEDASRGNGFDLSGLPDGQDDVPDGNAGNGDSGGAAPSAEGNAV